eukprot:Skav220348  [mRNA]  locus=scaffold7702:10885:12307:- [translate_table: standard]
MLDYLVANIRREQLETWFRSLIVAKADEEQVEISVTSQFVRDWLHKNYLSVLQDALARIDEDLMGRSGARRLVLSYRDEDGQDSLRLVTSDEVMTLVTSEFAITARELVGKNRTQAAAMPRQIAMFLLREHTQYSLEDIGRLFGNRDHTTAIYAVNKVRQRSQEDSMFKKLLDGLSSRLVAREFRGKQ